jgi:hypothetical protein
LDGIQAEVPKNLDKTISYLFDPNQLAGFRYILRTLEYGVVISHGHCFTSLSSKDQLEILEGWRASDILAQRIFVDILRAMLGMAYFSHPEILKGIGWELGCYTR